MSKLIDFLKAHGITVLSNTDSKIEVLDVYTIRGVAHQEPVFIDANIKSVKEFLNY